VVRESSSGMVTEEPDLMEREGVMQPRNGRPLTPRRRNRSSDVSNSIRAKKTFLAVGLPA